MAAASLITPVVRKAGICPILGFLFVGLLIGPHDVPRFAETVSPIEYARIADVDGVRLIAGLGIVFLLFMRSRAVYEAVLEHAQARLRTWRGADRC